MFLLERSRTKICACIREIFGVGMKARITGAGQAAATLPASCAQAPSVLNRAAFVSKPCCTGCPSVVLHRKLLALVFVPSLCCAVYAGPFLHRQVLALGAKQGARHCTVSCHLAPIRAHPEPCTHNPRAAAAPQFFFYRILPTGCIFCPA